MRRNKSEPSCRRSASTPQREVDLRKPVAQFMEMIQRWPQRDQFVGQMDLSCKHAKKSQLPPEASAAARECSGGGSIIPIGS